jgi:peptidylprolyl isomerase
MYTKMIASAARFVQNLSLRVREYHLKKPILTLLFIVATRSGLRSFGSISSASSTTIKKAMGFTKEVLQSGSGAKPQRGQKVTVHCTGYGKNRDLTQKFWSTKDPGQEPFTFAVGLGQGKLTSLGLYVYFGRNCKSWLTDLCHTFWKNSYQRVGRKCN